LNNNAFYNTPGAGNAFAPTTSLSTDSVPDVIGKVALDPGWGHYEVMGLTRWFRSRDTVPGQQANRTTHGYGFGGSLLLPVMPQLDFQASFLAGQGIGRYGSAGEPDATVNPVDGSLTPLHGYHVLTGLVFRPTADWTLMAYGGIERVKARSFDLPANAVPATVYGYGYGDALFSNAGCGTEGSTACAANTSAIRSATVGAWWKVYSGQLGNMQVGFTDTYIRREIFAGVGGNPSTNINIALASF